MKLLHALDGPAKRIADSVPSEEVLTDKGYSAILSALMLRYKPYLEVAGPASIDAFFYTGERARGDSFATFIAAKELQRQECELQTGEKISDRIAGRVLLRQAMLTDQQREYMALSQHSMPTFDQAINLLRPLDKMDVLTKHAGLGTTTKNYATFETEGDEENVDEEDENYEDEDEEDSSDAPEEGFVYFEDKEYDEVEAIYVQAYNDVRRDLKTRKKERGFVKHSKKPPKGRGRGRNKKGRGKGRQDRPRDHYMKGTEAELASRTRCWKCQELGHISRDCPNRSQPSSSPKKTTFIVHKPQAQHALSYPVSFPRPPAELPQPNLRSIRGIFVGLRCRAFEGLVDTAAEDAVMGSHALRSLREELATVGLQPLRVTGQQSIPCAGIGGDAIIEQVVDVPTCIAGLLGIIRFSVVTDSATLCAPPLVPVSYLEAVGATIDLGSNTYSTQEGYSTTLCRLPSGHRAINILAFGLTPWVLPREHRVGGKDPFQLDPEVAEHPPSPPSPPDAPSSQRFSTGGKGRGRGSFGGIAVGPPPTVPAPSGPTRVTANEFVPPLPTELGYEELEPASAMSVDYEFDEEGGAVTSEGGESPPMHVAGDSRDKCFSSDRTSDRPR